MVSEICDVHLVESFRVFGVVTVCGGGWGGGFSARVRYSLNNARLRKVKARAYCQYYCRFGKCTKKEKGECKYIHDSDKVAVCSNWLNSVCSDDNCPLTHEVRKEEGMRKESGMKE